MALENEFSSRVDTSGSEQIHNILAIASVTPKGLVCHEYGTRDSHVATVPWGLRIHHDAKSTNISPLCSKDRKFTDMPKALTCHHYAIRTGNSSLRHKDCTTMPQGLSPLCHKDCTIMPSGLPPLRHKDCHHYAKSTDISPLCHKDCKFIIMPKALKYHHYAIRTAK